MPQSSLSSWLRKPVATPTPQALATQPGKHIESTKAPRQPPNPTNDSITEPTIHTTQPTNHDRNNTESAPTPTASSSTRPLTPTSTSTSTSPFLAALTPPLPALPPPVSFSPMTSSSVPAFRRLNALLLPIPYPQSFYDEVLSDPVTANITLLAFWDPSVTSTPTSTTQQSLPQPPQPPVLLRDTPPQGSTLIAGLRCRIYPHPSETTPDPTSNTISISTSTSTTTTEPQPDPPSSTRPTLYISTLVLLPSYRAYGIATHLLHCVLARAIRAHGVSAVTAHVWEANAEGRAWYSARGFEEVGFVEGYYRRLRPSGAVLVRRRVRVGEWAGARGDGEGV
ncbi:hypothetical protein EJ05DRAFT_514849 [Pseudovirgaria hyperparasitica]|uniref:N-acetyltransferase domain-containing protein n=1 Tax=Pseudovirgaria hyperparasitica TaxID=470096 RepID=A0A6A6VUF3_9PEZI|nr:uncharacterized protein EJ05DRAFT_514849 [Pseudovirgaria hyperparasitica]KAF2753364.1 hypothetical protein EJ05DRAFT_514849 [Pseudovirgaria hyperparasitica]